MHNFHNFITVNIVVKLFIAIYKFTSRWEKFKMIRTVEFLLLFHIKINECQKIKHLVYFELLERLNLNF